MSTHTIHIFISHAWAYSTHYDTLSSWISNKNWTIGQASLFFKDYSIPKDDPVHVSTDTALKEAIKNKISRTHVVVIPTGMYTNYSKWIQKEIDISSDYSKPILAVTPRGQEKESSIVKRAADEHVGWNSESVINAIWQLYYNNN